MSALFWFIFTISIYWGAKQLYRIYSRIWLTPLLITPAIVIIVLILSSTSFDTYHQGAGILSEMVEPATIALAVMLYKHWDVLKQNVFIIAVSVISGALGAIITSAGFAHLLGLDMELMRTLAPRSATTPIALSISSMIGGLPIITGVATLITGVLGMIIGPLIVKWFRITSPIARGVLFGTSAHSAGVSKAFDYSPVTGSIAGIAMLITAFATLCAAPWLMSLF